jgi:hypothetical protein
MGPGLLAAITDITGGRLTFPMHNLQKIGDATGRLAIELRNQYLIAYDPRRTVGTGTGLVCGRLRLRILLGFGFIQREDTTHLQNDPWASALRFCFNSLFI